MAVTVAVLGPGGVGGLLAGLLARAGHRVVCLAGAETAQALGERGITVRSGLHGEFTVAVEADTVLREAPDVVLVAVKQTALAEALERVPVGLAAAGTLIVPLLNGVEHLGVLRNRYPGAEVVGAAIRVESTRVAPGVIEHTSPFNALQVACGTPPPPVAAALAHTLRDAGADVVFRDGEQALLWEKLAFLAPFALLTTYFRAPAETVRAAHRERMLAVVEEVAAVARAAGAGLTAEEVVGFFDMLPPAMKSSMLRDVEAGRPTELDAIGGAVLRAAERCAIAVPATAGLVAELETRF